MRVRAWVLVVSLLAGIIGGWTLRHGAEQYTGTLRTFVDFNVVVQPDSLTWLDNGYSRARVTLVADNASERDAVVENVNIHMRFDGDFAGSNYEAFEPVAVPRGESRNIDVEFTIISANRETLGPTAEKRVEGTISVRFDDIDRTWTIRPDTSLGR